VSINANCSSTHDGALVLKPATHWRHRNATPASRIIPAPAVGLHNLVGITRNEDHIAQATSGRWSRWLLRPGPSILIWPPAPMSRWAGARSRAHCQRSTRFCGWHLDLQLCVADHCDARIVYGVETDVLHGPPPVRQYAWQAGRNAIGASSKGTACPPGGYCRSQSGRRNRPTHVWGGRCVAGDTVAHTFNARERGSSPSAD
jgi:hypothetical protein